MSRSMPAPYALVPKIKKRFPTYSGTLSKDLEYAFVRVLCLQGQILLPSSPGFGIVEPGRRFSDRPRLWRAISIAITR